MSEISAEYFTESRFREAYEYSLDLWSDILDQPDDGDRFTTVIAGADSVKDDIQSLFGFTEGEAEVIMQKSFRDMAEAKGVIGGQ